jgi:hypothetical protein
MAEKSLSLESSPPVRNGPIVNPIVPGDILSKKLGPSHWVNEARLYEPEDIAAAFDAVVKNPSKYRILRQCFPLRNGS